MTQYGPEFFRKFADIITEAETVQLDEGIVDTIKQKTTDLYSKVKQLPGFAEAYAKAKPMAPQIKQIFTTSKSGVEFIDKIKQLTGANTSVAEGFSAADKLGGFAGVGISSFLLWEMSTGLADAAYAAGGALGAHL